MTTPTLGTTEENQKRNIDDLNSTLNGGLGLNNLNGQIIENIKVPFGREVAIPHSLGSIPKYRLILRQNGAGSIIDGNTAWSDTAVFLRASKPSFSASGFSASYNSSQYTIANVFNSGEATEFCSKVTGPKPNNPSYVSRGIIVDGACLPDIAISGTIEDDDSSEFITITIILMRG